MISKEDVEKTIFSRGNINTFEILYEHDYVDMDGSQREDILRAAYIPGIGCIVKASTTYDIERHDSSHHPGYVESITFVPGVKIVEDVENGNKLVSIKDYEEIHGQMPYAYPFIRK